MTNYYVATVDEFIAAAPEIARPHLSAIRTIISTAIPYADEKIDYGKPYYKYHGWVTGLDVYSKHIGLEIWDGLQNNERQELEALGYKTGSKTFQIRYDQSIPAEIIATLVIAQAKRNEAKAAA